MKTRIIQTLASFNGGSLRFGEGLTLDDQDNRQLTEPVRAKSLYEMEVGHPAYDDDQIWLFRNRVVLVEQPYTAAPDEIIMAVKHEVLSQDKNVTEMKRDIELFEQLQSEDYVREPIPREVQMLVWRRDQGRCVKCGSSEKLEFDHMIPLSRGGSNTFRNVQLLCEGCNRQKGDEI